MYSGQADWTLIGKVKNNPRMHIPIIGNGDITSPEMALKVLNDYGVDGIMVGRASIGNPWIFREIIHYFDTGTIPPPPELTQKLAVCRRHIEMSVKWKGEKLALFEMRRHYCHYFKGIFNFKPYRMRLVTAPSLTELYAVLDEIAATDFTKDQPLQGEAGNAS
jgi:tRNA-dihydrouridine synthase